jgi:hypothetical protein
LLGLVLYSFFLFFPHHHTTPIFIIRRRLKKSTTTIITYYLKTRRLDRAPREECCVGERDLSPSLGTYPQTVKQQRFGVPIKDANKSLIDKWYKEWAQYKTKLNRDGHLKVIALSKELCILQSSFAY